MERSPLFSLPVTGYLQHTTLEFIMCLENIIYYATLRRKEARNFYKVFEWVKRDSPSAVQLRSIFYFWTAYLSQTRSSSTFSSDLPGFHVFNRFDDAVAWSRIVRDIPTQSPLVILPVFLYGNLTFGTCPVEHRSFPSVTGTHMIIPSQSREHMEALCSRSPSVSLV